MHKTQQYLLFFLFALSGCAGLIYESMWSYYLGLFLGHAAYAQTLTLSLFMGGLALGAWLTGRYIQQIKNALLLYVICELVLALFGVAFHTAFVTSTAFSYDTAMPALASLGLNGIYKYLLSALLVLPQAIILGATFPLLSSALIRWRQNHSGELISTLYFTNSIGAAFGALAAIFILLPRVGTDGALYTAAIINAAVAIVAAIIVKLHPAEPRLAKQKSNKDAQNGKLLSIALSAAAITGAASFIYEIAWIRMLNLVLGTTLHTFELMLSAFILGLALGGLWIRKRIDHIGDPLYFAGYVQIAMGLAALLTMPLYLMSFDWVASILQSVLQNTELGYTFYNIVTSVIAMIIMVPSTFCAGMVLPLLTVSLLRGKQGEKSIGKTYAFNTLGAIIGVSFATHIGMTLLGLKWLLIFAATLDACLGLYLIYMVKTQQASFLKEIPAFAFLLALLLIALQVDFDPSRLGSGTFRYARTDIGAGNKILYYEDGKTASISVIENSKGVQIIATNGKPDASLSTSAKAFSPDETTMIVAAALPLLYKPEAEYAANIGFGSGLTSHTILSSDAIKQLDTVEIEPAMSTGAKHFYKRNKRVYDDTRSNIVHDDAKVFFAGKQGKYDFIVSEPSNPWVSGVGSLFSREFYAHIQKHLKPNGLLIQWLQLYEISPSTLMSALKALDSQFAHYDIYLANTADLIIVAKMQASHIQLTSLDQMPKLKTDLERIGITNLAQINSRLVSSKKVLSPLIKRFEQVKANSDYFPVLSIQAPRDRFTKSVSTDLINPSATGIPYKELLSDKPEYGIESLDKTHPLLQAFSSSQPYTQDIKIAEELRYMAATGQLGEYTILHTPEEYCGVSPELEIEWLQLMLTKAKIIHTNLGREARLKFSQADFQQACEASASLPVTKLAIKLQNHVATRDWDATFKLAWKILGMIDQPAQSATLANYALNHLLFSSILIAAESQALGYIDINASKLSPVANSVTRWLQAIAEDHAESQ